MTLMYNNLKWADFFLTGMGGKWHEGEGRILLGDNTGDEG